MTNIEIQRILDAAYDLSFLGSIEHLKKYEVDYKKSEFYKENRIPLNVLYEKYFLYKNSRYGIEEKFNDFFERLDLDKLANLFLDWLEKLENTERINQILSNIIEKFDLDYIKNNNQELKKLLNEFKKLQ